MSRARFTHLLRELARLRAFRNQRRTEIPLRIAWRWYQRLLMGRLEVEWQESYAFLEGDYFHIPARLDFHGVQLLTGAPGGPAILEKFCSPGTTAIDVGANIGRWAVQMAKLVGQAGALIAFEPNPVIANSLRKTFRVNGLRHAEAHALALSDAIGDATLYVNASDTKIVDSGISSLERQEPGSTPVTVRTIALDHFLEGKKIPRVSFIKIDVEGHEHRVLAGARATLQEHRPALLIEAGLEPENHRRTIAATLRELSYEPVGVVYERHIAPAGWSEYLTAAAPPFEANRAVNLLLLPNSL
jgi:FkbM family methyltransferase